MRWLKPEAKKLQELAGRLVKCPINLYTETTVREMGSVFVECSGFGFCVFGVLRFERGGAGISGLGLHHGCVSDKEDLVVRFWLCGRNGPLIFRQGPPILLKHVESFRCDTLQV